MELGSHWRTGFLLGRCVLFGVEMNERIRELAKQAGAHWNHGDFNMGSSVEFQEGDLERFAELIVQECLLAISKTDVTLEEMSVMIKCHDQVEKHFGVEE